MSKKTDICLICLRTDRKLKIIDNKLSDFHDELCDYSVTKYDPQYCSECEYLLRKMYKFRVKCLKALEILNKWKKSKGVDNKPISFLCTLLPESSLSFWISDNSQIYSFSHGDLVSVLSNPSNLTVEPLRITTGHNNADDTVESQNLLENSLPKDDIKQETDEIQNRLIEEDSIKNLKDILVFKNEDTTNFEEILFKGNGNLENDERIITDDRTNDFLNDLSFSDDDDDKLIYLKRKYAKKKEKQKRSARKRSSKSDSRSEDEINSNDCKKRKFVKKETDCSKNVAKKNNDSKEAVKKKVVDKVIKKTRFHTRKAIIAELTNMIDTKTKDVNEQNKLCKKRPFSKERLKEEIQSKFASCGELRATDGTVIDKEFILHCLEDKVTEFVMKQLYQAVYRKSCIKPKALKLFKCIQNKYKNEYDSVFDIEYLNTKEKMLEEFEKRKTYASYITAEFKCEVCYQGFKHEKKLQYHKKCHDETAGEMVCSICRVRHRNMKGLINHMNTHEAIYRCKLCPLVTYYKNSMQNHYQQHQGVKYTCKQCNTIFGSQDKGHSSLEPPSARPAPPRLARSMSAFRTHISYRHARGHVCTACGRAYSTRVGLRAHLTRDHQNSVSAPDGAASVKCSECSLSFSSSEACVKHARVSHQRPGRGRPPGARGRIRNESRPRRRPVMTCRVCGAVGSSWGWLSLHFSLEHPAADVAQLYADKHAYLCHQCGKSFSTIYTLQAHLNVHSGSRPFACDSCSSRFHRALSLRLHRLVHTPPSKPCETCGKKFRSTSNLYNHMRSHIGDRRYKCDICGKGFIHRCSLNEHVRGVHKNIRRVRKRGITDATEGSLALQRGIADSTGRGQ